MSIDEQTPFFLLFSFTLYHITPTSVRGKHLPFASTTLSKRDNKRVFVKNFEHLD